jgi:hypothetical protein
MRVYLPVELRRQLEAADDGHAFTVRRVWMSPDKH